MNRNLNGETEQPKKTYFEFFTLLCTKNAKMHGKHHVWQNDTTLKKMYFEGL